MDVLKLIIIWFSSILVNLSAVQITQLTNYKDFNKDCVAHHLQVHHDFEISYKSYWKHFDLNRCHNVIRDIKRTFYESLEAFICQHQHDHCMMQLIKRHNVSEVFLKAIGYNYFKTELVAFEHRKNCDGLIKSPTIDNVSCERVLYADFSGDYKSLWRMQSCLDDLFGAFDVNQIYVGNDDDVGIGLRNIGGHAQEFFIQLKALAQEFCSDMNLRTLNKFYWDKVQKRRLHRIPHVMNCFREFFISNKIIDKRNYEFIDNDKHKSPNLHVDCNRIIDDDVEELTEINLFGFTEPSRRVKKCIIDRNKEQGQLIEQNLILPLIVNEIELRKDYIMFPQELLINNTKKIVKFTLECMQFF